jgi:RNA polymerase sigma-70 factor (ECF subfamily)
MTETTAVLPGNGAETASEEFTRVFSQLVPELVEKLARMLGNHADAQDASQHTFLKCWRARIWAPEVRNLRAWIFRVGLNAARDLQRDAWRRRIRPLTAAALLKATHECCPRGALEAKEGLEHVQRAILRLRREERAVFLLRQNAGLSYDEIARLRQIPSGTAKSLMRAALKKLRRALQTEPFSRFPCHNSVFAVDY